MRESEMNEQETSEKLNKMGVPGKYINHAHNVIIVEITGRARNPQMQAAYDFCKSEGFQIQGAEPMLKATKVFALPTEKDMLNW